MNENLNLVEILKDTPRGTKLYSPIYGKVTFIGINEEKLYPIEVEVITDDGGLSRTWYTAEGKFLSNYIKTSECLLFPSKEQRDWSKFVPPLKEGSPVLVSDNGEEFALRYYMGSNYAYVNRRRGLDVEPWRFIIPFDKFDPNNIEESLKYNIVK